MNSLPDPDSELEALLRRPLPPLPDDGFSARVVAALPQPSRTADLIRWTLCSAGASAGIFVAVRSVDSWQSVGASLNQAVAEIGQARLVLDNEQVLLALLTVGLSLAVAFWRDPTRPSVE